MELRIMVFGLAVIFFCAGYVIADEKEPVNTEAVESSVSDGQEEAPKYCPVCGPEEETHGLALGYKYKGKKYTFCSMECLKTFKKDPEQFLKEKHMADEDKDSVEKE